MKLIDILVQELPKRGGWPEGTSAITQDQDMAVNCYESNDSLSTNEDGTWFYNKNWTRYLIENEEINLLAEDHLSAIITREQYESALAASKSQEWDGIGLPPVGCECEFSTHDNSWSWTRGIIRYLSDATVVAEITGPTEHDAMTEFVKHPGTVKFRQLRTEAERKREEAVKIMNKEWRSVAGEFDDDGILKDIYGVIYDAIAAGKIPGVYIK